MKGKKRKLELLSFYDHTGIERHLADMAQKGWMIERMSNYFWTYRKIQPQKLIFTVSYFPKVSDFDPGPSEAQQTLFDFCAETGWALACTWFQMQVFYSAEENPTPIHTEPSLEVAAIHNACKKNYLRIYKVLCLIAALATILFLSSLISDTLRLLASPTALFLGMGCTLLFLYTLVELRVYNAWHRKAKKQGEYGMFLDTPSTAGFQKGMLLLLSLCLLYWLVSLAATGNSFLLVLFLAVLLCLAAVSASARTVKEFLKQRRVPSKINRGVTAAASFVVALLLWSGVLALGVQLFVHADLKDLPAYAEAPFTISDLRETAYDDYLTTVSPDKSLFLERLEVRQQHGLDDEPSADIPELQYELYRVKVPAFYGFCEKQLKRLAILSTFWKGKLVEQDAAPWGAERTYRLYADSDTKSSTYLLCYPGLLVRVEFSWEPSGEQMGQIGRRLGAYG